MTFMLMFIDNSLTVEQYINAVTYVPLSTSFTDVFDHHYIHITTTNTNNVLLDDELYNWNWQSIHSDNGDIIGYGTVHEFNDTLPHVLRHTDITAGLSVIGYGSKSYNLSYNADGYTYLTGMNLNIIDTGKTVNLILLFLITVYNRYSTTQSMVWSYIRWCTSYTNWTHLY